MGRVLIVSPHMDDETIGAGGTLLKYKDQGHSVYWLNIANMKEAYGFGSVAVAARERQRKYVISAFGFDGSLDLELRPAHLDEVPDSEALRQITPFMEEVEPDVLILPSEGDIHSDHGRVWSWMRPFTKTFRYPSVKTVLAMEVLYETDFAIGGTRFAPDWYGDITDQMERKIKIARLYEEEIPDTGFPRSAENIRVLAQLRGAVAGVKYAEAFELLRHIE